MNHASDERKRLTGQHPPVSRQDYWEARYREQRTGWDRGQVHPALISWQREGVLSPCRIVVPGCGRGYEVVELARAGHDVTAIDFALPPLQDIRVRLDALRSVDGRVELLQQDVFDYEPARPFDAIYEQTCLCAIDPSRRNDYANQMKRWLLPGGRLFLLLLQTPLDTGDPPYHCDVEQMRTLFPASDWEWPNPPFVSYSHPTGIVEEWAIVLQRRDR